MGQLGRRSLVVYALLAAGAAAAIVFGLNSVYGFFNSSSASAGPQRTATVSVGTVQSSVSASGNVGVATSASAGFTTSGTLTALNVDVGDKVKAGQTLAKIDPTSAQNALQQAEANLEQARSTLTSAESGLTTAQRLSNTSSLAQGQDQLTNAKQTLVTDKQTLADAKKQLAADIALDCPTAGGGSSASSANAEASSGSGSAGTGSSSTGATGTSSTETGSTGSGSASAGSTATGSTGSGSASAGSTATGSTGLGNSTTGSGNPTSGSGASSSGAAAGSSSSSTSGSTGSSSSSGYGGASTVAAASVSGAQDLVAVDTPTTTTQQASPPTVSTSVASSVSATGASLAGTVNPEGFDTYYHFEYGTTTGVAEQTPPVDAGSGSAQVQVSVPVTGLQPGTTYYFRLAASNTNGEQKGAELTVTTAAAVAPVASTGTASGVSTGAATLSGTVDPQSNDTSYYFEYGTTKSFGSLTPTVDAGAGTSPSQVSALLTGLKPGTTYVYELVASSSFGVSRGITQFFTTSTASSAVTGTASNLTTSGATLNGTVDPQGANTSYYFEYGPGAKLNRRTAVQSAGASNGSVSVSATVMGLGPGKKYGFRIVTSNVVGSSHGEVETFTTPAAAKASVTAGSASGVGMSTATLSATVDPNSNNTSYRFEYGRTSAYGSETRKVDLGAGSSATQVSAVVSGLKPGATYVFRLVATNAYGTAVGAEALFTTSGAPGKPTATTSAASSLLATGATLTGTLDADGSDTSYYFEYGRTGAYGSRTRKVDVGTGSTATQVSANVSGLKPGTSYTFRLIVTNAHGTSVGAAETFTTIGSPTATTSAASSVLATSAALDGTVDAGGSDTTYYFEYGRTASADAKTAAADAGAAQGAVEVTTPLTGLKPDTSYMFRLVATNRYGKSVGTAQVVTTAQRSCTTDSSTVTTETQTVRQAEASVSSAELSLEQTHVTIAADSTPDTATIAQDEATIAQDEATVATDRSNLDATTLRAPMAGTVTAVNGSVGQTISASGSSLTTGAQAASSSSSTGSSGIGSGTGSTGSSGSSSTLVTIDSLDKLEVVSGFPEADATQLAAGQPATITFPALPETEVAGKLTALSSTSTVVSNVVTYNATITLINPPPEVKEGMTANVSVATQTRSNVLELPSSAITTNGTASTVQLLENGKTTVTPVKTGLVGASTTEIVSGLKKGDVVVEPTVSVTAATASTTGTGAGAFGGGGGGLFGGGGGGAAFRGGG